ncbi:MAG: hypothetical protein AB2547_19590, partial [Candidatus Thiodiazotropha endolucinida]|uniref:hypothetical protein n=1 Tax=Candidatus Thiodiazotropha endolucinida TaxID=1655433 RepID=UPI001F1C6D3D
APKEVPLGCALIGAFSGTTGRIGLVLTGPSLRFYCYTASLSDLEAADIKSLLLHLVNFNITGKFFYP